MIYAAVSLAIGLMLVLSVALLIEANDSFFCESTAEALRVAHRMSVTKGCLLEVKPGVWAPVSSLTVSIKE